MGLDKFPISDRGIVMVGTTMDIAVIRTLTGTFHATGIGKNRNHDIVASTIPRFPKGLKTAEEAYKLIHMKDVRVMI